MKSISMLVLLPALAACAHYDGPPDVTLENAKEGLLADPKDPIVLAFSKPPVASTFKVEIAPFVIDTEGNLGDEDADPKTQLDPIFSHDPVAGDKGGAGVLAPDGSTFTITPAVAPPVGSQLVVVVEPGLADAAGTTTNVRRRIVFGYQSNLDCSVPTVVMRKGTYFFVVNVDQPVHTQVRLFGVVDLDAATGSFKGRFTSARRNPDPNRCPMPCMTTEVCRLLPAPACVAPSEPASSDDEYPDYVANADPPTGFNFAADGCAVDQSATTSTFSTAPVDVGVTSPPVTLRNTGLSASFTLADDGTLRGTGSLTADAVLLGMTDSGKGHGNMTARSIPDAEVPPGLPQP